MGCQIGRNSPVINFILKLSKLCNLRCTYCYEYDELAHKERMPLEGLEYFFRELGNYAKGLIPSPKIRLICHGGEPLLLPHDYLRNLARLKQLHLDSHDIVSSFSIQSNLVNLSNKTLDLIQELNFNLGVSLDVFGQQRIDINGKDSQDRVFYNLQSLLERKIPFSCISVLHALNIDDAVKTYHFFNELGICYRILPIFSHQDTPDRIQHLMVSPEKTVKALQEVAQTQLGFPSRIQVDPIYDYLLSAVRYLTGNEIGVYQPTRYEWAIIVNTNGDIYAHGDAYLPIGKMGNIFCQSLPEIFQSNAYSNVNKARMYRAETCRQCEFDRKCNQLPIVESIPSERFYNESGELECKIAKPMIQFMIDKIRQSSHAHELLTFCQ